MKENEKKKYAALTVVILIFIAAPLIYLTMHTGEDEEGDLYVAGKRMELDELGDMETVSGESSYQNRFGNWDEKAYYEGVPLSMLVPNMKPEDVLEVTASDGYSQRFSYRQIFPCEMNREIQGNIILAYSMDGVSVPDWEDGPMIAVLSEDGEFSNADLNMTKSLVSDYNRQSSAGSLWVKNVERIEVIEDIYTSAETVLTLEGTTVHDYTMEQIHNIPSYTADGKYIKTTGTVNGPYTYRGVNITKLVYNVYSGTDYTLEVEATDGYIMTYTSDQVQGSFQTYDEDGNPISQSEDITLLLAYEEVGEDELHGGPLRIVTVSENPQITDGHFWAKMVRYIRVKTAQEGWTLELEGIETVEMDKQTFGSATTCDYHKTTYVDGDDTYGGLPLWILVSTVDSGDTPQGHYMFNDYLVEEGYNVKVEAGDGFSTTFTAEQVARNDSIMVANTLNGEPLTGDDFPLRIVGDDLSGKQKIRNIVKITLTDLPDLPDWTLTLTGVDTLEYDAMAVYSLVDCGAHTVYYNYTDEGIDYSYKGIPLWIFVGAVDDEETSDHWTLENDEGYQVKVTAGDGYNYTFDIEDVAHNNSIILATHLNEEPLTGDDAPLRIVGDNLSGKMRVSNVVEIELVGL
ncbi:MAG: hypothetical protein R6U17_04505 [Thermoplasmata archaeon]